MRTVWHEPAAYSWKHDRRRSEESYRQWADAALAEELGRCPDLFGGPDYVMGFRDGFVDFVYLGGTGEPPPVPPRHFWNVMLRSPEGKQRANLWFDGYRHGAAAARDGGYRELGRVNSSLLGFAGGQAHSTYPLTVDTPLFDPPAEYWPDGEVLPEPPIETPAQPLESDDVEATEPASEPALVPETDNAPEFIEPPFRDDPEPPAEEADNDDQPMSTSAPDAAQLGERPAVEMADGETSLETHDAGVFNVQPAVLMKVQHEINGPVKAQATNQARHSTARLIEEPAASDVTSDSPCPRPSGTNYLRFQSDGNHVTGREFRGSSFRGWSRRVTTESTLDYRTPPVEGH
jgi:hypothetical protein